MVPHKEVGRSVHKLPQAMTKWRGGLVITYLSAHQLKGRSVTVFGTLDDWNPGPGTVVSWHPSSASSAAALQAPASNVPASYQQAQHLRAFQRNEGMSRLCVGTWRVPGVCDIAVMTEAINRHVRRHDTYRSWFDTDLVRHSMDPSGIELLPVECGVLSSAVIREHLLATTASPFEWDCFSFGIVQHRHDFTFYGSVDHLHTDGMSSGIVFLEIQMTYNALLEGDDLPFPGAGSYDNYCVREREHTAGLSLDSPQIQQWIDFAAYNDGSFPSFPLPLGEPSLSAMVVVPLMDGDQSDRFDAVCRSVGARFSGGVFACAAIAEHQFCRGVYCGLTPVDTRTIPAEFMTVGWFASLVPVTVPVGGSFGDVAKAAQVSFDAGKLLANAPFHRALELVPQELLQASSAPMLSFIDIRKIPLSVQWDDLSVGIFGDSSLVDEVFMWVNRFEGETSLTLSFPDNPVARGSVARYAEVIQGVYADAAASSQCSIALMNGELDGLRY
jgi:hypothetical protein